MGHSIHALLLLMLTRWSVWTLREFFRIFFDLDFFWYSDLNFSTWEISNLIFDFHIQWSFNAVGHSIHALLLILLTRWSVWTLKTFFEFFLTYNFYLSFRLKLFFFGNIIFDFLLQWSFNAMDHSIHAYYCYWCWLGDPFGHLQLLQLDKLWFRFFQLVIFIINFFNSWSFILLSLIQYTDY